MSPMSFGEVSKGKMPGTDEKPMDVTRFPAGGVLDVHKLRFCDPDGAASSLFASS